MGNGPETVIRSPLLDRQDDDSAGANLVSRQAALPIPVLLITILILWAADLRESHESVYVLMGMNFIFSVLASLAIATLVGRSFMIQGSPALLFLGGGVVIWGAAGSVGVVMGMAQTGAAHFDANVNITIHNTCVWLAALCHLAGAVLETRWQLSSRVLRYSLACAYTLALVLVGFVVLATTSGWLPTFFIPGQGGTPVRQFVLGSAIVTFAVTGIMLRHSRSSRFTHWYSLALLLLAVGLFGGLVQPTNGSLVGWAGRMGLFLAGAYMLVAAVKSRQTSTTADIVLVHMRGVAWRNYSVAVITIINAAVLRQLLAPSLGSGFGFITFYPAVILVALYGGLRAGLLAAVLSATIIAQLPAMLPGANVAIGIFLASCFLVLWIIEHLRRAEVRAVVAEATAKLAAEREQAAGALIQSEARYRQLVEQAPDGIFVADAQGHYVDVNPSGAQMLGYTREEILTMGFTDILCVNEIARLPEAIARFADGAIIVSEWRFKRKDGSELQGEVVGRQLPDGRFQGILRDVTDRQRAQEALRAAKAEAEHANNAKSRFLAAASHDLRQPLSALSLYVGTLGSGPPDGELVSNMKKCVASLSDMLTNLLDLSKLDAGVVEPTVSDFLLDTVIAKIVSSQTPGAKTKGLVLRNACFGVIGRTDATLLQRIVENLVANAIRYTEQGGALIGTRRRQGKVWIEVWDTGIGIPADMTAEIFEEFRQLGNYERNRAKGTGLGLAIVAKTAALLGLQIRVQSRLGKGSMFAVELPLGESITPVVHHPYTHRALRIALVEDNADVAVALTFALTHVGHQVVSAVSGSELLSRLEGISPDIVISDYRLAGNETGVDVIGAVRAGFRKDLPALIITGDTDPSVIRRMAAERIRVQHKPLDIDVLRSRIADLTAEAR